MPIYLYECTRCNREQEHLHKVDGAPDEGCEFEDCEAGPDELERRMGNGAVKVNFEPGLGWDGWDKMPGQPGMVSRTVDRSKAK